MGKGTLVFKGEKKVKKKKNKSPKSALPERERKSKERDDEGLEAAEGDDQAGGAGSAAAGDDEAATTEEQPQIQEGQGRITTSGTVISGHDGTRFQKVLRAGDALLVGDEMRVVTMILSNESAAVSTPFAEDMSTPTPYQYIVKPRPKANTEATQKEDDGHANGIYGTAELVYRERTEHGSYRIRREKVSSSSSSEALTREALLDMRSKKKSDRYC